MLFRSCVLIVAEVIGNVKVPREQRVEEEVEEEDGMSGGGVGGGRRSPPLITCCYLGVKGK